MLERVPATAESAAHVFLKTFERPHRSARLLDPRFWQHDCDQLAASSTSAAWWPHYLQKIRQIPQTSGIADAHNVQLSRRVSPSTLPRPVRLNAREQLPRRSYSVRTPLRSAKPALDNDLYDLFGLTETIEREVFEEATREAEQLQDDVEQDENQDEDEEYKYRQNHQQPLHQNHSKIVETFVPMVTPKRVSKPPLTIEEQCRKREESLAARRMQRLESVEPDEVVPISIDPDTKLRVLQRLLDKGHDLSEKQLDRVWRLYIALPDQTAMAKHVFPCLARTKIPERMARASEAFRLIPLEDRDAEAYERATVVELEQDKLDAAIDLTDAQSDENLPSKEATVAHVDEEATSRRVTFLLKQLVRRELWNNLCDLMRRKSFDSLQFDGCAEFSGLPGIVLRLQHRVDKQDPTLEQIHMLHRVVERLSQVCFASESIMSVVSIETLLDLLHLQSRNLTNSYSLVLKTLSQKQVRYGKKDIALAVYRDFLSTPESYRVHPAMLGSLLCACGTSGYSPRTYKYILDQATQHLGKPSLLHYLLVLTLCAREGATADIEGLFCQFLCDHTAPPDIRFVSTLIYAYARAGDVVLAHQRFNEAKDKWGFELDTHCWNMLMYAHARSSATITAFNVFSQMREAGIEPDSYTYGILMAVCADLEDVDTTEALLAAARNRGIPVTVPMVNTLIDAYLAQNDFSTAHGFVLALTQANTSESLTRPWNSLLRHCAMVGNARLLVKTRNEMQDHGIKPDAWTYVTVLLSLTFANRTAEARTYFQELLRDKHLVPMLIHYHIILHGLVLDRNFNAASALLQEMGTRFEDPKASSKVAIMAKLSAGTLRITNFASFEPNSIGWIIGQFGAVGNRPQRDTSRVKEKKKEEAEASLHTLSQAHLNIILQSLLRNNQSKVAKKLLKQTDLLRQETIEGTRQARVQSVQYAMLKMDLSIAQSEWKVVEHQWAQLFKAYQSKLASVPKLLSDRYSAGSKETKFSMLSMKIPSISQQSSRSGNSYRRFNLSKPLNRYIEAMAQQNKQRELIAAISEFESAGFELSGVNWNKYIQVLARSQSSSDHIRAFSLTEKVMLNRAQSWTLLRRGLLRKKTTSYVFEKLTPDKPRPVLTKDNSYSVTDRLEALHADPKRKIPTYTTMVYLARALQHAQAQATQGQPGPITQIGFIAKQTKHFLEQMPRLKDDKQGKILRYDVVGRPVHDARLGLSLGSVQTNDANKLSKEQVNGSIGYVPCTGGGVAEDVQSDSPQPEMKKAGTESVKGPASRPRALPYVQSRILRNARAARQRRSNSRRQSNSSMPISAAGKRLRRHRLNIRRRSRLLKVILVKDRPTVEPLPRTKSAYRVRRRTAGAAKVRFVFDLNRWKKRYAVRRGFIPETRWGLADIDQSQYMVNKSTGQLSLDRNSERRHVHEPIPRDKRLVQTRRKGGRARAERVIGRRKAVLAHVKRVLDGSQDPKENRDGEEFNPLH